MSDRVPVVVYSGPSPDVEAARLFLKEHSVRAEVEGAGEDEANLLVPAVEAVRARELLGRRQVTPEAEQRE